VRFDNGAAWPPLLVVKSVIPSQLWNATAADSNAPTNSNGSTNSDGSK
jgi:hypothetical protein